MKKNLLFLVITILMISANCWDRRFLQGYGDPNCAQWNSDGSKCLKCIPRSYNNTQQNACIRVDDNCKTWSQTDGSCIKCYDSYGDAWKNGNAINGKCPYYNGPKQQTDNTTTSSPNNPVFYQGYDVNCKCFSDQKECLECYDNYRLDSLGQCLRITPNFCMRLANGVCVQCQQGYYLNRQLQCIQLPANCTKVDEDGNCTECTEQFILTQNSDCVQQVMNCTKYDSQGMCKSCQQEFYLDSENQCSLLPDNCITVNEQGNCTQCEQGYNLDTEDICIQIPKNCLVTDQNAICIECIEGYYLDQSKQCHTLPQNCTFVNSRGQCNKCEDGFVISNGQCIIQVGPNPDCAQQDQKGKCAKCRHFYQLQNGTCTPTQQNPFCKPGACQCGTGKCLQCQKGYFLDNHGICTKIGQNCKTYSKFNGSCTSCKQNYESSDGECIPSNGGNQTINLNCKTQSTDGTCKTCRKYYKLVEGDCIPNGQNPKCHLWNSKKQCQCCYYHDRYYLDNNNICQQKNVNCAQINPQDGTCTLCQKGSTLKKGKCISSSSS